MSRSERLLQLLQVLRRHRLPVSGGTLAAELAISLRTLYRDIATLQAQGADIEGEAGIGYVLKPTYMLPPLMFTRDEIEALMLGFNFVAQRTDDSFATAARDALAKINAVLPDDLRGSLGETSLLVGPGIPLPANRVALGLLRQALRQEYPLDITYRDLSGQTSRRTVWPFALSYFDGARVLMTWCTLRHDFRNFRSERIEAADLGAGRYPKRRAALLKEWRQRNNIPNRLML
jgi:predicted DNA-binding transcriptional regulator YafY